MKRILALILALLLCLSACAEGEILAAQDRLYSMGYLSKAPDGAFSEATAAALRAYQQENGLPVTGELDESTLSMLLGGTEQIRQAQVLLIEMGYMTGAADGKLGAQTIAALNAFQQVNDLPVTGSLDDATLAALYPEEFERHPNDMPMYPDEPAPAPVDELLPTVEARLTELGYLQTNDGGYWGATLAQALTSFQRANGLAETGKMNDATHDALYSEDAKGNMVRMAQRRLVELGYLIGYVDGSFGEQSRQALANFKAKHGLPADGKMNQETWDVLFSDAVVRRHPTLSAGHKGETVHELQARLIELGFMTGTADGHFGSKTANAIQAFQEHLHQQGQAEEIEADGEADPETQRLLFDEEYSSYLKSIVPGDQDGEVLRIERRLCNLKYMDAEPDDVFDPYASDCLEVFQRDQGMLVTGMADKSTMDALFKSGAGEAKRYVARELSLGDAGGVVQDVQEDLLRLGMLGGQPGNAYDQEMENAVVRLYEYLVANGSENAELFRERGVISIDGQRTLANVNLHVYAGQDDARVERRLDNLFYMGKDGLTAAIEKFQMANGLEVTGVADERTQERLFSKDAIGNWSAYMLEIRIDEQRVYAYALNEENEYEPLHQFICSTGLGAEGMEDATPQGVFKETTERLNRWHYFTEYKCWAQYSWRIIGNYYFHSVLYDEQDEKTLRESSVYNLGRKASHGCVRLEVEAAKWIFENCNAGTIVYVH